MDSRESKGPSRPKVFGQIRPLRQSTLEDKIAQIIARELRRRGISERKSAAINERLTLAAIQRAVAGGIPKEAAEGLISRISAVMGEDDLVLLLMLLE